MRSSVELSSGDHVVHFYRDDADLAATVGASVALALHHGESVIVIATSGHRDAFAAELVARGIDVAAAEADQFLLWRDAEEIASDLLETGGLDAAAFDATVGSLVRDAARERVVHAYGEIVSVLWSAGEVVAAIELERLWNDLIAEVSMSLLCGYPADLVADDDSRAGYLDVCGEHGRIAGTAPIAQDAEVSCRFPGTPAYARHARRLVIETLHSWGHEGLAEPASLVVSELASNAIRHADSEFTIGLARSGGVIRIVVGDSGSNPPRPQAGALEQPHGRGLLLVEAMSLRWGHDLVPGGKLVWAEFIGHAVESRPAW